VQEVQAANPAAVRTDNGPEFTSRAFLAWAHKNGYIKSLNGKFKDECLNEQWFDKSRQHQT